MLFASTILVAALFGAAQAQTPKGFTPTVTKQLDVIYNGTTVKTPGELLAKAAVASQPQIALPNDATTAAASNSSTFMFVMLDLDVPGAAGNTTRRVLLHALNTGFQMTTKTVGTAKVLAATSDGPAPYLSPGPPATDTTPHRYVQLLFEQPASLNVAASDFTAMSSRIGFDVNAFMKTQKLSAPLAANFFTVDGKASAGAGGAASGTGKAGSGAASGTGSLPKSTAQPFTGEAGRSGKSLAMAGVLGGLVALAV